jgi:hypothetical protein
MKVLTAGIALLMTAACGDGRTEARLLDYRMLDPFTAGITVDGCHTDPVLKDVEETATEVRIAVRRDPLSGFGQSNCLSFVEVVLNEPLGDRALVNAYTGEAVRARI